MLKRLMVCMRFSSVKKMKKLAILRHFLNFSRGISEINLASLMLLSYLETSNPKCLIVFSKLG